MSDELRVRSKRELTWLSTTLVVGGLLVLWFLYRRYEAARDVALMLQSDATEVQRLSQDIHIAGARSRIASLEIEPSGRISQRVEAALQNASIDPIRLMSIDPQTPSRIGRTPYLLRLTQIELQELSMKQVLTFILALRDTNSGMTVRDLDLSPRKTSSAREEFWDVRLTLTQMIFSPISDS